MSAESYIEHRDNGFDILHQDGHDYTVAYRESPGGTCGRPLRGGRYCTMDHNHRGKCSSVTFNCDSCGKQRRGSPAYKDIDHVVCFMCVADSEYGYPGDGGVRIYLNMSARYKKQIREARERRRKQLHERYLASEARRAAS